MPANDSKSYLSYLNALVDQYNNTYHGSTGKKPLHDYYSTLSEKLNRVMKLLNLKLVIVSGLLNTIKFLVVSLHQKLVKRNICCWLCAKTSPGAYKIRFKRRKNNRKLLWQKIVVE